MMMTEDELRELERGAPRMALISQQEEIYLSNLRELANEVRRLNAAYAQAVAEFTKSDDEHADYFRQWLEHIFEPLTE